MQDISTADVSDEYSFLLESSILDHIDSQSSSPLLDANAPSRFAVSKFQVVQCFVPHPLFRLPEQSPCRRLHHSDPGPHAQATGRAQDDDSFLLPASRVVLVAAFSFFLPALSGTILFVF
jgi:hypothetical protein